MLMYFSAALLQELLDYYIPRFRLAEERGFSAPDSKYFWLYEELRLRISVLRQAQLFIESLPKFMEGADHDKPMQYAVSYTSAIFAPEQLGTADVDPFFNDANPYWLDFQEASDNFVPNYNLSNLPLCYVDLCEYIVRTVRLYLQIREMAIHANDKGRFAELMHAAPPVKNAG